MAGTTLDELAALSEELLAGLARMRETVDAMGRSLSALERTVAELRQDVTRLGERVEWIGTRGPTNGLRAASLLIARGNGSQALGHRSLV